VYTLGMMAWASSRKGTFDWGVYAGSWIDLLIYITAHILFIEGHGVSQSLAP
jgi:hypothetical protein